MGKNIVYCSDGTWNAGARSNTNVYRLYQALAWDDATKHTWWSKFEKKWTSEQISFYDKGVGATWNPVSRLRGGAFGEGLLENVREGYERIVSVYESGDKIFLFGFSRGAYTARSIGGMIAYCGLPSGPRGSDFVDAAFAAYKAHKSSDSKDTKWRARPNDVRDAGIEMIGVWDTVGSLGIPGAVFGDQHQDAKYRFLNTQLSPCVAAGYHALAIDERRRPFTATLWTAKPDEETEKPEQAAESEHAEEQETNDEKAQQKPKQKQVVEQVWFVGVHGDVGGSKGLRPSRLSDITLAWMWEKAKDRDLKIRSDAGIPELLLKAEAANGTIRDKWRWLWGKPVYRTIDPDATLADSVRVRLTTDSTYDPRPLKFDPAGRTLGPDYLYQQVIES